MLIKPIYKWVQSKKLLVKMLIPVVAYIYIYYRLSSEIDFFEKTQLFEPIQNKLKLLIICILLMTINWFLESIKWKILLSPISKISISEAVKSVLVGLTYSIFTPYRLGEFAGRPSTLSKEIRISSVLSAFLGSIAQSTITLVMGTFGLILLIVQPIESKPKLDIGLVSILLIASFLIISILILYFNPKILVSITFRLKFLFRFRKNSLHLRKFSLNQLAIILFLSAFRYLIFFSQYFLLLSIFEIHLSGFQAFTAISLSYLFLFSIPGIPIAEPGIRGSLALFFIGMYSSNQIGIISASTSLWIINLAIPSIIGSFLSLNDKKAKS